MATHHIEAERTPRGSLVMAWPTDAGPHDRLVSALADTLEEEMADRTLHRVTVYVEVDEPQQPTPAVDPMSAAPPVSAP